MSADRHRTASFHEFLGAWHHPKVRDGMMVVNDTSTAGKYLCGYSVDAEVTQSRYCEASDLEIFSSLASGRLCVSLNQPLPFDLSK